MFLNRLEGVFKLNFVDALRTAGARVDHCFVIFHYGIFPEGLAKLRDQGVELHALATWWDALAEAEASGYLPGAGAEEVRRFLNDPDGWAAARADEAVEV